MLTNTTDINTYQKHTILLLLFCMSLLTPIQAFSEGIFLGLGDLKGIFPNPKGGISSIAWAVSGDGNVVVGTSNNEAFRWTSGGGMVGLGDGSYANSVSGDGKIVVGYKTKTNGRLEAFRWTSGGGMVGLGALDFNSNSNAQGVSRDGSTVVGFSSISSNSGVFDDAKAFRWTAKEGIKELKDRQGNTTPAQAKAVSGDGSIVVGQKKTKGKDDDEAFIWTKAGGIESLSTAFPNDFSSDALGISTDGSVVVGFHQDSGGNPQAYRWTKAGGLNNLGYLPGAGKISLAVAVSGDGNVVVGESSGKAFRWTQSGGMQSVSEWLTDNGVIATPIISTALGANDDGSVVVGELDQTLGQGAYIARVSKIGTGLIKVLDLQDSLASIAQGISAFQSSNIIINGAHDRPMSHHVSEGKNTVWLSGNWSYDGRNTRDDMLGLAEISGGHNFGLAQVNISLGKTWYRKNLIRSGKIDSYGNYVMVEGIIPIPIDSGLYVTIGTYYEWGDSDIHRSYINSGARDTSKASPDMDTWSVRVRVDWESALTMASIQFSPYVDLSYIHSHLDSYTETGGGFPAHFNSRNKKNTELHAGFNMAIPLFTTSFQLVTNIEVAHRFDHEDARISGKILGLSSFDLLGHKYDPTWVKGGVGVEGKLGIGKISLMLNGTTEGEMPSAWFLTSYQIVF
jgi:probable HAF family extracellular repeat protein